MANKKRYTLLDMIQPLLDKGETQEDILATISTQSGISYSKLYRVLHKPFADKTTDLNVVKAFGEFAGDNDLVSAVDLIEPGS